MFIALNYICNPTCIVIGRIPHCRIITETTDQNTQVSLIQINFVESGQSVLTPSGMKQNA